MLNPVASGEVAVAEGDQGGHCAERLHTPRAAASRQAAANSEVATTSPDVADTRRSSRQPDPPVFRRRTNGDAAIASTNFDGPRNPGTRPANSGASRVSARKHSTSRPESARRRPYSSARDQQAVAKAMPPSLASQPMPHLRGALLHATAVPREAARK